jgi:hypothetical protein
MNRLNEWFNGEESNEIITEIITKLQLCNIGLGDDEDQLLFMDLLREAMNARSNAMKIIIKLLGNL